MLTLPFAAFIVASSLACLYDIRVTKQRLAKYGLSFELNQLTRFLCGHVGPSSGVYLGVLGPHIIWTVVAAAAQWETAYALYTGWLGNHFIIQRASQAWEVEFDQLREIQKALKTQTQGESQPTVVDGDGPPAAPPIS